MTSKLPSIPRTPGPAGQRRGFTLIELMIVVVVVGILMALAYPSFMDQVRKSRRADAVAALTAVQQAQERWRANRPGFADNSQLTAAPNPANPASAGLGISEDTSNGYYTLRIDASSNAGYTATARAVVGKSQANDGDCVQLRVRAAGGNIFFGSAPTGGTTFNENSDNRCWVR